MLDRFANVQPSLSGPALTAFAVTPDDGADLAEASRAIYVGSAGNLSVKMLSGEVVTFAGLAAGALLPVRVSRIRATGTTAGNIIALA